MSDIKKFFREIRSEQKEIFKLQDIIKGIQYQMKYEGRSKELQRQEKRYERELNKQLAQLISRKRSAGQMISKLESTEQRQVMQAYYLAEITDIHDELPTWEIVADELNYSPQHVHRLHGRALLSLSKSKKEESK